ncbi:MAG: TIGR02757 family protein [Nitrospirae bacterium]|nr:TIGR02757 family protein [Nitrospirota bacterium]
MKQTSLKRTPRRQALSEILEGLCRDSSLRARREEDPVVFPHRYRDPEDIETAGLIAASFAFGRVDLFRPVVEKILVAAGPHPAEFLADFRPGRDGKKLRGLYYRMVREEDLIRWLAAIGGVLRQYGSLRKLFTAAWLEEHDPRKMLERVSDRFHSLDPGPRRRHQTTGRPSHTRGFLQLTPSPRNGGACKRWNMYLRWMVRPADGIDFGLWTDIPPSCLIIPLDTHIHRIAGYLGLTSRKNADWKTAEEITAALRAFDPEDPVKYDFALCHVGISGQCPAKIDPQTCRSCPLARGCSVGRRKNGVRVRGSLPGGSTVSPHGRPVPTRRSPSGSRPPAP